MPPRVILQITGDLISVLRWTDSRVLSGQYKRHSISDNIVKTIIATLRSKIIYDGGNITNPFYSQIVKIIENAFYNLRYTITISSTGYDLDKVLR